MDDLTAKILRIVREGKVNSPELTRNSSFCRWVLFLDKDRITYTLDGESVITDGFIKPLVYIDKDGKSYEIK